MAGKLKKEEKQMKDKKYRKLSEVENWKDYLMGDHENLDTEVICIHCGNVFKLGEALIDPSDNLVVCKYAPECDGNLIDFWSIKEHAVEHGISYEKALKELTDYFGSGLNPEDISKSDLIDSKIYRGGQLFWLLLALLEGDNDVIEIVEEEFEDEDEEFKDKDNVINIVFYPDYCGWSLMQKDYDSETEDSNDKKIIINNVLASMIEFAKMNDLEYNSEESRKELVRQYIKSLEKNCIEPVKVKKSKRRSV